jgi:bifunctional non-homologous end joining protein LigD
MTDQLSLRLDPDVPILPNPPATLRPMLARPLAGALDSPHHLFEPSWAGQRVLAFIGPADHAGAGAVRLVDGEGRDHSPALPELAGLAVRVDARSAVLDGELVVVDGSGRADPGALSQRLEGRPGRPIAFLVFDLLHLDGRSLLATPLARRRQLLRRVLRPGDEVLAVPGILAEGRALLAAVTEQGVAGVMARRSDSPYLPGVRSSLWRFIAADGDAPQAGSVAEAGPSFERGPASVPILALISRLPLPDAEGPEQDG